MLPSSWVNPCWKHCTKKYAALTEIPWRIYCKKGCSLDTETWEECVGECDQLCYKDPVYKDLQWTTPLDRSPGTPATSEKCFYACVSGCGAAFDKPAEVVEGVEVYPNREKPSPPKEPAPIPKEVAAPQEASYPEEDNDLPSTSA